MAKRRGFARIAVAALALLAIGLGLWQLERAREGLTISAHTVGRTPVTVFRNPEAQPGPVVLIAHGFAGSQQLMQSFALTLARAGYLAVTFDYLGHGRHPDPMTGDVTAEDGTTLHLLRQMDEVSGFARSLPAAGGGFALIGHSMASDLVVRQAARDPATAATVAVSLFSREVTGQAPRNLLVITGAWESGLTDEALRVLRLAVPDGREGVTYGDPAAGTARRVVFADEVEHIGVLYSSESLREARAWLDAVFGRESGGPVAGRGPWLGLLIFGIIALGWPLARLLPRIGGLPRTERIGRGRLALLILLPALLAPPLAVLVPRGLMPLIVGDYLASHFLIYGLLTVAGLRLAGVARPRWPGARGLAAAGALALYVTFALGLAFDRYATSFLPLGARLWLIPAMLIGTLPWFLADEWLTRATGRRGAYALTKIAFVLSLALAIALDFERLFFLIIVAPVILVFFLVYGLFSRWTLGATGNPWVAGTGLALALAWAIAVTFPMLET